MQCVILAGGLGTRMRPLTDGIPKTLLPVGGHPFAYYQLHWLASQGVTEVVYCIGHRGEMIRDFWNREACPISSVVYVEEGEQLRGTGGAIGLAREKGVLHDHFFVLYGDSFLPIDFGPVWSAFEASGLPALMTVLRNEGRWDNSNANYRDGRVVLYDKSGGKGVEYIDYGLSAFRRDVFASWSQSCYDLAAVLHNLSIDGQLAGFEVTQRFYEIGSPAGLLDFEQYLASQEVSVAS